MKNPQQIRDKVLARMLGKPFHEQPECPFCYSLKVSYETVDVGVGAGMKCSPTVCDDCQSSEMYGECSYCFNANWKTCAPCGIYDEELAHGWWNGRYMGERMYLNSIGFDWQACAEKYPDARAQYEKHREEFYKGVKHDRTT